MSHEVQIDSPYFLNFLSKRSLGASESNLSLRPGQQFTSNKRKIGIRKSLVTRFILELLAFLNFLSERSLGVAASRLIKDYIFYFPPSCAGWPLPGM